MAPPPNEAAEPVGRTKPRFASLFKWFLALVVFGVGFGGIFWGVRGLLHEIGSQSYSLQVHPGKVGVGLLDDASGLVLIVRNKDTRVAIIEEIVVNGEYKLRKDFATTKADPHSGAFAFPLSFSLPCFFPVQISPGDDHCFLVWAREGKAKEGYEKEIVLVEIKTDRGVQRFSTGSLHP